MPGKAARSGSAPTSAARRLRPWRVRLAGRRSITQWRLVAVVATVAVLAATLITSLGLLVSATELGAVRGALATSPAESTELRVSLTHPAPPLEDGRAVVNQSIGSLLGGAADATSTAMALSELWSIPRSDGRDDLAYFGELEELVENATLTDGLWPSGAGLGSVAVPAAAARQYGLTVGSTLTLKESLNVSLTVTVVGIFDVDDASSPYWAPDLLDGEGHDPAYPVPGSAGGITTDAIGPLVVGEGAFDATETAVDRVVIRFTPDFSATTVESIAALGERLETARDDIPTTAGAIADTTSYSSSLGTVVDSAASSLSVTRSTVVVVSLLLFVLAVAALAQAARLLTEARVGERHLMRARGATGQQLVQLAAIEALVVVALTAGLSPVLARLVYLLVASQPAMTAAGMSVDPGVPVVIWQIAAAIALLFGAVIVAPLLRGEGSFHDGEQGKARPRRFSSLQRSGVDVALLVLAAVAYWQLLTYRSPANGSSLAGVDPVLVAGPALVLLAGAFLAVRLVPAAAGLTERISKRARGAVVSLASWEVGRRSQRATAAILLLTLALAVGTFSHSFLATWRQSQIDQAQFALGAPVRVTAAAGASDVVAPDGNPQSVIRLDGVVAGPDERITFLGPPTGDAATIVGLTQEARELLQRGRLAVEGGDVAASSLTEPPPAETSIELPPATAGLEATVTITPETALTGVSVRVRILVVDADGVQSLIDLGVVKADGEAKTVRGELPGGLARDGLRIIGFQAIAFVVFPELDGGNTQTATLLTISGLRALDETTESLPLDKVGSTAVVVDMRNRWRAAGNLEDSRNFPSARTVEGAQLALHFTVPVELASNAATYLLMGWPPATEIPAVLTTELADAAHAEVAERLTLIVAGVAVPVQVVAITPHIPGGGPFVEFGSLGGGRSGTGSDEATVLVDEVLLARALFQAGYVDIPVREWWLAEVPSTTDLTVRTAEGLGQEMQEHPLRVATQGALLLVIAGAGALAAVGFAIHATGSLRSRALEFAQLRAIGLSRRRLVGIITVESLLLCLLGSIFGIGLGLVLSWLVTPLIGASPDGSVPIPDVRVLVPWADIAVLAAILALVLAIVVLVAARMQRVAEPANVLRRGDER